MSILQKIRQMKNIFLNPIEMIKLVNSSLLAIHIIKRKKIAAIFTFLRFLAIIFSVIFSL